MRLWLLFAVFLFFTGCGQKAGPASPALEHSVAVWNQSFPDSPEVEETIPETSEVAEGEPFPIFTSQPLPQEIREEVEGCSWKPESPVALEDLFLLTVTYWDWEGKMCFGELVVSGEVSQELLEIFQELYQAEYPIHKMVRIEEYGGEDLASMEDNNTYAYCCRVIAGTSRLSRHSYGAAVDINPVQNPFIIGSAVFPEASREYLNREEVRCGMIIPGDACHRAFVSRGWIWGGDWPSPDYQHFEKPF